MNSALLNKIRNAFSTEFGSEPIVIFSPGRINLIGEHIDYNDGFVFPAAIDKGIALAMQKTDGPSTAIANDFEESFVFEVDNLNRIDGGGWRNYLIGVICEVQKLGKQIGGFNVIFGGNVPSGAGLSSSAALENAIVFGLNELFNLGLTKKEMILVSQMAEHHYVGVKCGIMDQFASMFGEENHFLLLDCRSLNHEAYQINLQDFELLLLNTNVQHNLSDSTYNKRRALCERAAKLFGEDSLRDVSKQTLFSAQKDFSEQEFEMVLYVLEEIERTKKAAAAIAKNDIEELGSLLFQTHKGLSSQYQVSCNELDFLVDFAKQSKAVIGARMMGGGFGGCTINLVHKDHVTDYISAVSKAYADKFGYDCTPINVAISKGTHRV